MKIIALVGAQNVGKTATLLELISIVKKAGGSEIESSIKYGGGTLLNYKGHRIGITTEGDTGDIQEMNCDFFKKNRCDVMFTATRTRGATVDTVYTLAEELSATLIWAAKSYYAINTTAKPNRIQFNTMNKLEAQFLFNMID